MPWIQKLEILQRRCRGSIASKWSVITAEFSLPGCGNVSTRRGALPLLDALWLFHPSWAVVTEIAVICGCPWPIQASFCLTRWAFSFSLFFSLPLCCRRNWGKFWVFFVLEGVWNQPACSAFTVPCRPVRGAKVVVAVFAGMLIIKLDTLTTLGILQFGVEKPWRALALSASWN